MGFGLVGFGHTRVSRRVRGVVLLRFLGQVADDPVVVPPDAGGVDEMQSEREELRLDALVLPAQRVVAAVVLVEKRPEFRVERESEAEFE